MGVSRAAGDEPECSPPLRGQQSGLSRERQARSLAVGDPISDECP
jgi:hypothetical protein